jgi:UDP-glucose 4-epimerase
MKNSRVLITGGAGLIGSHIADIVATNGPAEIVVLDNFTRGRREHLDNARRLAPVTIVEGDITDRNLVREVMAGIDVVFHQAAIRITHCAEDPRLAVDVLVNGSFNVVEAAAAAKVRKVVAASSASIYGMAERFPTDESHHAYNNRTIYGAAKAFDEGLLRSFHEMYGLDYVALRYFNVYGPRMDTVGVYTEVFIRWMDKIAAGGAPMIFGDGLQTMDFVNVHDIARANVMAATSNVTDEVFNVASGTETSLRELAELMLRIMGSSAQPEFGPARKVNPVSRRLASTEKARRLLGFTASVSMAEGLRGLVAWWQEQRLAAGSAR